MGSPATGRACDLELPPILNCLTEPAIIVGEDHQIVAANQTYRDRFAAGTRVCGRRCYEVSHHGSSPCDHAGENCPLLQSRASKAASRVVHTHFTAQGESREEVCTYPIPNHKGVVRSFLEVFRPLPPSRACSGDAKLTGRSPAFHRMLALASRVAPTETTVLLLGESGTGKEFVARAIHDMSSRQERKFVPVDCTGLSESLFESELFGHERGAFTGAAHRKIGLVESCTGGTLFLDEVGDIPLTLQVKLLRLLETGLYRRVGSAEQQHSDFRLICATHRDLPRMVEQGQFRQDLYFRINTFPVRLPALRERLDDLPLFIESHARCEGCNDIARFHPDTLALLRNYSYPGNIREFLNIVERACLLSNGDVILPEHLPPVLQKASTREVCQDWGDAIVPLAEIESRYLRWAASRFRGGKRELARRLGLSERTLYRKLNEARARDRSTDS